MTIKSQGTARSHPFAPASVVWRRCFFVFGEPRGELVAEQSKEHPSMTILSEEEARQGETKKRMRYVLGISLALAVIAMLVIVLSFV